MAESPLPDESACPICFSPALDPCITPCGHVFCTNCIRNFFATHFAGAGRGRGPCPMCRTEIRACNVRNVATNEPLGSPPVSTIFGQVYVPLPGARAAYAGRCGLGNLSFHFDSPGRCYVNCSVTESKYDDGSDLPDEVPMESVRYDTETRTLKSVIAWAPPAVVEDEQGETSSSDTTDESTGGASPAGVTPKSLNGAARWELTAVFDEYYAFIADGSVVPLGADGCAVAEADPEMNFPDQLRYCRLDRRQGLSDTVFMQNGTVGVASYHFPPMLPGIAAESSEGIVQLPGSYISYEAAPPSWSLADGSPPPRRKPFETPVFNPSNRTFEAEVNWGTDNPFGGSSRWIYRMVFDPEYTAIVDGECRAFDAEGIEEDDPHRFGVRLMYIRSSPERDALVDALVSKMREGR